MPLISVIIPTYTREKFVTKAIDSVLKQSFRDYEIIVIDDGSTDNTREILKAYANKIKYIYQENSGVSSARNVGIQAARGLWISFLDSDDEWNEDQPQERELVGRSEKLAKHLGLALRGEFGKAEHLGEVVAALGREALCQRGNAAVARVQFNALDAVHGKKHGAGGHRFALSHQAREVVE